MKKLLFIISLLVAVAVPSLEVATASAAPANNNPDFVGQAKCQDTANCIPSQHDPAADPQGCSNQQCDIIGKYLNPFIKFLGIALGLAVTIGIAWGGIEYASSGGDPSKTASGKKHITWSIISLVLYFFLYALIKFLAPGV